MCVVVQVGALPSNIRAISEDGDGTAEKKMEVNTY